VAFAQIEELVRTRELTWNLVRRDLKVRHRGTFLGMLWSLTNPLLIVGLYWFIFTFIFKAAPTTDAARPDGTVVPFAIYLFSGLTLWGLFNTSAAACSGSIVGSGYLLGKVYFPRAILPLSAVLSAVVTFGFEICVLLVITLALVGVPSLYILWLPVIVAVAAVFAFGLGLLLATFTVFLRDVAHFIGVFLQLWFWGTPIIYSLEYLERSSPQMAQVVKLNPMTGVVVSFRNVVVLNRPPALTLLAYDALVAVVVLVLGAWVFGHWQKMFSEIV
jgi:lipopolysaccharide transport system permease protein